MSKPSNIDKLIEQLTGEKAPHEAQIAAIDLAIERLRSLQTHSGPKPPPPTRKRRKLVGSEPMPA